MEHIIEWQEHFYASDTRTVLTHEELQIPGLALLARHTMANAVAPLPKHFHKDCFEFTFVVNGAITFTVDEHSFELSGRDVFVTFPNEIHSTNLIPLSVGEIIWFQIRTSSLQNFLFLSEEAALELVEQLKAMNGHLIKAIHKSVLSYVRKAFELSSDCQNKYRVANYIVLILYELIAQFSLPVADTTPDIERTLKYVSENIRFELSLDELAALANLSVSQFKQKFKQQIGISPRHYINYRKIQVSKKMLLEGIPVTDIAMELGFNTSSYFSVVFKRYNACTPSEYMKQKQFELPEYFKESIGSSKKEGVENISHTNY